MAPRVSKARARVRACARDAFVRSHALRLGAGALRGELPRCVETRRSALP
jgi:hypothetical protein